MKHALTWFQQQNRRDQSALLLLALALALYALLQGVVRPLQAAVETSRLRLAASEQSLASVQALAGRLETLQANAVPASEAGNLALQVDASAVQAGVLLASMEPAADGSSVALRVDGLALAALMQWLQQLATANIVAESLVVLPARGGTELSVNLRLVRSR